MRNNTKVPRYSKCSMTLLVALIVLILITANVDQRSSVDAFVLVVTSSRNLSIQKFSTTASIPTTTSIITTTVSSTITTTTTTLMMNTDDMTTSTSNTPSNSMRPETNFGSANVPEGQRPINEYLDVTNQPFFTWARDSTSNYDLLIRFGIVYILFFIFICYPISGATFTQDGYLLHQLVSSNVGAIIVTMLLLLRVYTGYDYIGQRLQSKYIEYEETGWYDGDVEIKTKTELLRDRMLYTSQVQPIVERLKMLVTYGTTYMVGSILLLNIIFTKYPVAFNQYDPDILNRLSYDDTLADSAAINTNGKPAYCDSRYYRAIANGGLGCN